MPLPRDAKVQWFHRVLYHSAKQATSLKSAAAICGSYSLIALGGRSGDAQGVGPTSPLFCQGSNSGPDSAVPPLHHKSRTCVSPKAAHLIFW